MSQRQLKNKDELPRDANVVTALRRELNRNSRRISQAFWHEFEQIRQRQRQQLAEERTNRQNLTTMMQDANQEAQQQLDALSRSISSHGINPSAPSPRMRRETLAIMPSSEETARTTTTTTTTESEPKKQTTPNTKRRPIWARQQPKSKPQLTTASSHLPLAPPTSRATIAPAGSSATPSMRSPPRNSVSKLKLSQKPKK